MRHMRHMRYVPYEICAIFAFRHIHHIGKIQTKVECPQKYWGLFGLPFSNDRRDCMFVVHIVICTIWHSRSTIWFASNQYGAYEFHKHHIDWLSKSVWTRAVISTCGKWSRDSRIGDTSTRSLIWCILIRYGAWTFDMVHIDLVSKRGLSCTWLQNFARKWMYYYRRNCSNSWLS